MSSSLEKEEPRSKKESKGSSEDFSKDKKAKTRIFLHSSKKSIRTGDDVVKSLKWVIFPDNKYIKIWDLVVLVALFLFAFILPYQIGVSGSVTLLRRIPWLVFNIFLNSIFFVDTFLYFFRAYYTPNGHLVLDLKKIRRKYLQTYFVPNFISVLPYTVTFYAVATKYINSGGNPESPVYTFLSFITFASVLKLIRLTRVRPIIASSDFVSAFRVKRNSQVLELWKYVWLIVAVSHWFACIWSFVAFCEAGNFREEDLESTANWISYWWDGNKEDGGINPLGWQNHIDRYVLSLFWAIQTITSIGYGNIVPVTRAEYFTACGLQLAAGIMWAYVIGGLVGVAAGMQVRAETFRGRIDQANELIHNFDDPEQESDGDDDAPLVTLKSKQVAKHIRKFIYKQYTVSKADSCITTIPEFFPVFDTLTPALQKASSVLLANRILKAVTYLSSRYMTEEEQSIVSMKCANLEFAAGETIDTENPVEGFGRGVFVFRSGCAFNYDKSVNAAGEDKLEKMGLVAAGMAYGAGKVLLGDENFFSKGKLEFLTFSQVAFIPREAILEALKQSERAWKECARWVYLRTLIQAKIYGDKNAEIQASNEDSQ